MSRNSSKVDITTERPLRVALYGRVSSEDQAEKGTIETQQVRLRAFVEAQNWVVSPGGEYWDNGVTGTLALRDREAGAALLWAAGTTPRSFDHVLVYKLDRLGRSAKVMLEAFEALKKLGISIRSITEPFDTSNPIGEFVFQLLGSVAQLERSVILERTASGIARAVAKGKYLGGKLPYGYVSLEGMLAPDTSPILEVTHCALTPVEVVRLIFSQANAGMNTRKIADHLTELGVPPRNVSNRGRVYDRESWRPHAIGFMLSSTTYRGAFKSGSTVTPCPELVGEDLWHAVQTRRWGAGPRKAKSLSKGYILQGKVRCVLCGRVYAGWVGNVWKQAPRKIYYRCVGATGKIRCKNRAISMRALEDQVWGMVLEGLRDVPTLVNQAMQVLKDTVEEVEALRSEYSCLLAQEAELVHQRDRELQLYRSGRVTDAENNVYLDALELDLAKVRYESFRIDRKLPHDLAHPTIHQTTVEALSVIASRILAQVGNCPAQEWDTFRVRAFEEVLQQITLDCTDPRNPVVRLEWKVWQQGQGTRVAP